MWWCERFCGNVPLQITPIKIIVLTECNPHHSWLGLTEQQNLTFDKGGKSVGDFSRDSEVLGRLMSVQLH